MFINQSFISIAAGVYMNNFVWKKLIDMWYFGIFTLHFWGGEWQKPAFESSI